MPRRAQSSTPSWHEGWRRQSRYKHRRTIASRPVTGHAGISAKGFPQLLEAMWTKAPPSRRGKAS